MKTFDLFLIKIPLNHANLFLLSILVVCSMFSALPGYAGDFKEPQTVLVPGGPFLFGSTAKDREEYQSYAQEIEQCTETVKAFYIGKYELSNEEFGCFMDDSGYKNPAYWSKEGWEIKEKYKWTEPRRWRDSQYRNPKQPICSVSWYEAEAYCNWLKAKTGKPYRLPSEKEWEKAARGADGRIFPWGNTWNAQLCNLISDMTYKIQKDKKSDTYSYTAPVDAFPDGISPYGCYNMAGNVMEWCNDILKYRGKEYRVFKGGDYTSDDARFVRCAWRGGTHPEVGYVFWSIQGFRVAMDGE